MGVLRNLEEGEKLVGFFLIREREVRLASNGSEYATFQLEQKNELIYAKLWDITSNQKNQFIRKTIVKIEGMVISYKGHKEVNIKKIRRAREDDHVNITELISKQGVQREELWHELRMLMDEIESDTLRSIIRNLYGKKGIRDKLTTIPASKKYHHSYYAGLLDHIVQLTQSAYSLFSLYPKVNRDLVIATCLLHDIGKVYLFTDAIAPEYTMGGELMGHLSLSLEMIHDAAREEGIPLDHVELLNLKHCILSQSGEVRQGFGSAVSPKTQEALFFYHIKQMNVTLDAYDQVHEQSNTSWTYSPMFNRKMYTPNNDEGGRA